MNQTTQKTVLVLFGGNSSEYEVSLSSAYAVLKNIDTGTYNVIPVGITRTGEWYRYDGDIEAIPTNHWCDNPERLVPVELDLTRSLLRFLPVSGTASECRPDVVFPVLHGRFGEDGAIQGMFDVCGIPVVGCGHTTSGICMDKAFTKSIIAHDTEIPQADAFVVRRAEVAACGMDAIRIRAEATIGYPLFIKPAAAGSSVGVSKVHDAASFGGALETAFREDDKVLIEQYIAGSEVEVAVFANADGIGAATPAEIDLGGSEFYDYETKYHSDVSSYYLPARLSPDEIELVRAYAIKIFRTLDCRVFARVDFFYTKNGFVFNEINTIPGFTPISMYPKMMIHDGMTYAALLDAMIRAAL